MTAFDESRRQYLDIIQGIISRLAGNQFLIKGWALTVAAAILGYAAAHRQWAVALLNIAIASGFWALDAYFLRAERLYRHLWIDASKTTSTVAIYSLDISSYRQSVRYFKSVPDENGNKRIGAALAPAVAAVHSLILSVTIIVLIATAVAAA
jgi:hypothetical protein